MTKLVRFPPFTLDVEEERLWRASEQLALRRKPFAILKFLVSQPGRLVTHEEVLAHVWGGTVVSESALRSHLHELRQVLGDGVIETVIGRGYRFVASLDVAPEPAVPARAPTPVLDSTVVGRTGELARLEAALARAETGHRQLCFVTGEPGIGKTTLVEAFLRSLADSSSHFVALGRCSERLAGAEAYLPLLDAIDDLLHEDGASELSSLLHTHAPT